MNITLDTLLELLVIPGPSGDEGAVADFVAHTIADQIADVRVHRIGDNVVAIKGDAPKTAVFAHTDTTGYTLGYDSALIPIGGPSAEDGDELRSASGATGIYRRKDPKSSARLRRIENGQAEPGARFVYARAPKVKNGIVTAPYLDNRGGVWCALRALEAAPQIAVAFTTGEEMHGHGARVCAEYLHREHAITQAVIADLTWHTDDTPFGKGVVVSLRDAFCPRQAFLDRVLAVAQESGIPYQKEVQSNGSSDGGHIYRSSVPMDWVFVGAPEKAPHTAKEQADLSDLNAMTDLLIELAEKI